VGVPVIFEAGKKMKRKSLIVRLRLFPTGRSGIYKIQVGGWRDDAKGPMQVVSGSIGREKVHYEVA
jgi:hypothetical protein